MRITKKTAEGSRTMHAANSNGRMLPMVVEGEAAVELYTGEIARNLAELDKQAALLRDLHVETKKLLRDIE